MAATIPLLYALPRFAWHLGVPLGVSEEFLATLGDASVAGLGLGLFAVVGSLLTLGLVMPWGETFWSWVPVVGGRPVPVSLAVVPALFVSTAVMTAGVGFVRMAVGGDLADVPGATTDWATWAPTLLWPAWAAALAVAALAYRARRADPA